MKFSKTATGLLAVALLALAAPVARAAIVYDTDSSTLSVLLGQSETVNIYLHETGSTVIASGDGLFGTGFAVARDASDFASLSNPTLSSDFDVVSTVNTPALAGAVGNRLNRSDVTGPIPGPDGRVLIGTFTVTGDNLGTSHFTFQDYNTQTSDNITYAFDDLDSSIGNGALTVNVVPVPEPATAALAFAGLPVLLTRRRRRSASRRNASTR